MVVRNSLDVRYQGQSYTLNVAWQQEQDEPIESCISRFHQVHEKRYGHQLELPVELVNIRVALRAHTTPITFPRLQNKPPAKPVDSVFLCGINHPVARFERKDLAPGQEITGPALITETVSTTLVAPGWKSTTDTWGNLLLEYLNTPP